MFVCAIRSNSIRCTLINYVYLCVRLFLSPSLPVCLFCILLLRLWVRMNFKQQLLLLLLMVSYRCRSRCRYCLIFLVLYCILISLLLYCCCHCRRRRRRHRPNYITLLQLCFTWILYRSWYIRYLYTECLSSSICVWMCAVLCAVYVCAQRCYLWTFLLCAFDLRAFGPMRWTTMPTHCYRCDIHTCLTERKQV